MLNLQILDMIIKLKRFSKIGRTWSGIKGSIKPALNGALIGGALAPGNLIALGFGHKKVAAGITGAGALLGASIGGKMGWNSGVREYDINQKLKTAEGKQELLLEACKDLKESATTSMEGAKQNIDDFKISENYIKLYKNWFSKRDLTLPKEITSFILGCSKFFNKGNIASFYNDYISNPEKFITEKDISNHKLYYLFPEFFNVFPYPLKPDYLSYCEDDLGKDWKILIGEMDSPDDGIYYNVKENNYCTVDRGFGKSLKEILEDHLKFYETQWDIDYTPAQKRVFENYRKLVILPLK